MKRVKYAINRCKKPISKFKVRRFIYENNKGQSNCKKNNQNQPDVNHLFHSISTFHNQPYGPCLMKIPAYLMALVDIKSP